MATKFLTLLALAAIVSQGYAFTEVWLPDESYSHVTNPFIAKSIGIPKHWWDTLISCSVIFPDGQYYEAYPIDNLPHDTVSYMYAVDPFTSCSIAFRNSPPSLSGTYELLSHVRHGSDLSESLTRQRFHMIFQESETWRAKFGPSE